MDRKRVIVRHSIASLVALALFGGSRFLYNVIISRKYGMNVLGNVNSTISQAFLIAGFLALFSIGLGKYTAEFLGRGDVDRIKRITGISFITPLLGLSLIPINFEVAILSTLRAIQLTFRSFIYGLHRGEIYAYITILGFMSFLVGFFGGVLLPYYLFLGTISVLGLGYIVKNGLVGKFRREEIKILAKYSGWAFLGTISGIFLIQGPYFMTEKLSGSESAGIISAVLSTSFLLSYLPQVLQSAIVPIFAYDFGKGESYRSKDLAEISTRLISFVSATLAFLLLAFQGVIEMMFNTKVGTSLLFALIAVELYIAYNPLINLLSATRFIRHSSTYASLGALVSLISWAILIPRYGVYGTLTGLILGYLTILILVLMKAKKEFKVSMRIMEPLIIAILLQFMTKYLNPLILLALYIGIEIKDVKLFLRGIRSL
ncbi:hypothetical protein PNA2_1528 [Pyrococcus sp. NA2]|uniref:lipopolysaccharide biosynthesis protein n=1 Tax=Pyrococcus sp. (strain NA2) TaxID=342949 RepID=UPI000209B079|nr:hypothetical protein [Pyrococcus sp. NA2]AEC52444.1 hypothetical protein PNA2_1528 [Pyrococcus sp. NA2]